MAYTFDGPNKLIIVSAQTSISVRDIYSRWVDWFLTSDNSKYTPAFRIVGGEDIDSTAGTSIPIYAYLQSGWKIRPQESSHTLNIFDGVLLTSDGSDPFVSTLGSFAVRIKFSQPVQAITVSTGGGGGGGGSTDCATGNELLTAKTEIIDELNKLKVLVRSL
jgi:hypothetical protein